MRILIAAVILATTFIPARSQPAPAMSKQALSKYCSDRANAYGLRGETRLKFWLDCKRHGGTKTDLRN